MTSAQAESDYLRDLWEAIEKIGLFTQGLDFEQFTADEKTTYAVIRAFEVLGEAARHVPQTVRRLHPDIPWREMSAMRNKLIHEYFGVDLAVVWKTVQQDIPSLRLALSRLLDELE